MSDTGRKSIATQITEKVTPDSQKTTGQKVKEVATDFADRVSAAVTPNTKKSVPQQVTDKTRGAHDNSTTN